MRKVEVPHQERTGYKFCGYYSDATLSGRKEQEKTSYPYYRRIKYKISYKLNKGKNDPLNPKYYFYDTEVNLVEPTRTFYKFLGWRDGKKITKKIEKGEHRDIVLEAMWVPELAWINTAKEKPAEPYFKSFDSKIQYLSEMMQTQLQYFSLFEAKNTTLATVDTILLTLASLFTSSVILENNHHLPDNYHFILSIVLIVLVCTLLASLVVTLFNIFFDVGKRRKRHLKIKYNHHSISGIIHYSKFEFIDRINKISDQEVFQDLANQTRGLVSINEKNQKRIRVAVILDLVALFFLVCTLIFIVVVQNIPVVQP